MQSGCNSQHYRLDTDGAFGELGMQVKLPKTTQDLEEYRRASRLGFLLQEYVDYKNEVGIFYYRLPGSTHGHICGIVEKNSFV